MICKRIANDCQQRYKYRPAAIETFVEKSGFSGACYKAANWIHVGTAQGRGRNDRLKKHPYISAVKRLSKDILLNCLRSWWDLRMFTNKPAEEEGEIEESPDTSDSEKP